MGSDAISRILQHSRLGADLGMKREKTGKSFEQTKVDADSRGKSYRNGKSRACIAAQENFQLIFC